MSVHLRCLPPDALAEVKQLALKTMLSASVIVRIVESKYNFVVYRKSLRNLVDFAKSKLYPVRQDSAALLHTLQRIKDKDQSTFYSYLLDGNHRLLNVCFALPQ